MVWTEVSTLLAVVAGSVFVIALIAIVFQETMGTREPVRPRSVPPDAYLSEDERRDAMRRFDARK